MKIQKIWKMLWACFAFIAIIMWENKVFAANDSFTNATSISVNKLITDNMAYSNSYDENYYKFTISSPGYISINFSHAEEESTSVGWDIILYNIDREQIKSIKSQRSVSNVTSNNIGLPAGTYYVLVSNVGRSSRSTINYQLKLNYVVSNNWETEFNDGFVTADILPVNKVINGSMMYEDGYDDDYYTVLINKSGYVDLSFAHKKLETTSVSWDVNLYDSNRNSINTISVAGNEKNKKMGMLYLKKGTYYVRISNVGRSTRNTIDYQLKVYYTTPKANIKSVTSPSQKKMTVKWKKLKGVSGYEVVTANDKKFKKNKKVTRVNGSKKIKTTIKKLKRQKTYYVKMRGYITVDGQKYYGPYSKVKKVKSK